MYSTTGPDNKLNLTAIGISTLYALMDSSFWFETINLRRSIVYIKGSQVIISKEKVYFFLWRYFMSYFTLLYLANGVDPDEMPHSIAFH